MFKWFVKKINNRKGFTLVELVVVLAILGILGAIAVPKFIGIQDEARIKADAATASQIVTSARIMEISRNDGNKTEYGEGKNWDNNIMEWPTPQSGESFTLSGGLADPYEVKWTPDKGSITNEQTVTEGEEFKLDKLDKEGESD